MTLPGQDPAPNKAGARRVTALVFAAQGTAVAAVSTTIPAVEERFGLPALATTAILLAVALAAGAGSLLGMAAVRRLGPVAAMRSCVLAVAAALLGIAWAPDTTVLVAAYVLFGLSVGGIDVSANTRAAAVERHYGHSIFASFYAVWSCAGVAAALLTAGTSRLNWPVADTLVIQAAVVVVLALGIRSHRLPGTTPGRASAAVGTRIWVRLVPFGIVLLVAYVIDSSVSTWSAAYLHETLAASLAAAPLAYAAYQAGTVLGRAGADRLVRRIGPVAVVCWATVLTAAAAAGLAFAPTWPIAAAAAGLTGLGVSAFAPLCLASAGRLQPDAAEAILARLNLFNYFGVIAGGAVSGVLGSAGQFRLAYAAPALLVLLLMATARSFTPVRTESGADERSNPMYWAGTT
ncbi:MFS transporter [Amycolatopsis sp. NPDC051128]|uniref:MFS transporter n=1 Tax=Amycolatopsis sp. NPDC051128 TaxID=3155412 RepID=UPI003426652D